MHYLKCNHCGHFNEVNPDKKINEIDFFVIKH